jgi:hypothetical protein
MIDFTINDFRILTWDSGGCRPAEETELSAQEGRKNG